MMMTWNVHSEIAFWCDIVRVYENFVDIQNKITQVHVCKLKKMGLYWYVIDKWYATMHLVSFRVWLNLSTVLFHMDLYTWISQTCHKFLGKVGESAVFKGQNFPTKLSCISQIRNLSQLNHSDSVFYLIAYDTKVIDGLWTEWYWQRLNWFQLRYNTIRYVMVWHKNTIYT